MSASIDCLWHSVGILAPKSIIWAHLSTKSYTFRVPLSFFFFFFFFNLKTKMEKLSCLCILLTILDLIPGLPILRKWPIPQLFRSYLAQPPIPVKSSWRAGIYTVCVLICQHFALHGRSLGSCGFLEWSYRCISGWPLNASIFLLTMVILEIGVKWLVQDLKGR